MAGIIGVLLILSVALGASSLECHDDETKITGPAIYEQTSCGKVVSAIVDRYNPALVNECNRIMAYDDPIHSVVTAEVSGCMAFDNGTARYRMEVCCPEILTDKRCYTCGETEMLKDALSRKYSMDACNIQPVDTCTDDEACMTKFTYFIKPDGSTGYKVTKGCVSKDVCSDDSYNNKNTCKNDILYPSCNYCCYDPLCNEDNGFPRIDPYDPNSDSDPCNENNTQPSPCKNGGLCSPTYLPDPKFTCQCVLGHHGDVCQYSACQNPSPCSSKSVCTKTKTEPFYSCVCFPGWFDQHCTEEYSVCDYNICKNGGDCYEQEAYPRCVCPDGYIGQYCEILVPMPCSSPELYLPIDKRYTSVHSLSSSDSCTRKAEYVTASWSRKSWMVDQCINKKFTGFKNGRDGDKRQMWVDTVGVYKCTQGDRGIFYSIDVCCPACLSSPCENGGWCLQDGEGYACKCPFGYAGNRCQYKLSMCVISGDPHYQTCDSVHIPFQGICKYDAVTLAEGKTPDFPPFSVHVKQEQRAGNTVVAYVKYIEVTVYGHLFRLGRDNVVTVDGVVVDLGVDRLKFADDKVTIQMSGAFVRLETDFGLIVQNDGEWVAFVKLPAAIGGLTTGICGNCNGDSSDDYLSSTGGDLTDDPASNAKLGNSYKVDDPEDPNCPSPVPPNPPVCDEETDEYLVEAGYCGLIKNPLLKSPFEDCLKRHMEFVDSFFDTCKYDVCANILVPGEAKKAACGTLLALAEQCAEEGYNVDWRGAADCPMNCSNGRVYAFRGPACPATCTRPRPSECCPLTDTETCVCPDDQVLRDGLCVEPEDCGCIGENGEHIETGYTWTSSDCRTQYTCEFCEDCHEGFGHIVEKSVRCPVYAPKCIEGQCHVPCEKLRCFSCHNTDDVSCWITGRYRKCKAEESCFYRKETLETGRHVVTRGCAPFTMCPAVNTAKYGCEMGSRSPPEPEKQVYTCRHPRDGICSCKGDPHCITYDGMRIPDIHVNCSVVFTRDGCSGGVIQGPPSFRVLVHPKYSRNNTRITVTSVTILYGSLEVKMGQKKGVVTLDGTDITLSTGSVVKDATDGVALEFLAGKMVRATLSNGVIVEWDFSMQVAVTAPPSGKLLGKLCGICGNFGKDGPSGDFITGPASRSDVCPNLPYILGDAGLIPGQQGENVTTQNEAFAMSWLHDVDDKCSSERCKLPPVD